MSRSTKHPDEWFKCNNCETGRVQVHNQTIWGKRRSAIKPCDSCGKQFGLFIRKELTPIKITEN